MFLTYLNLHIQILPISKIFFKENNAYEDYERKLSMDYDHITHW